MLSTPKEPTSSQSLAKQVILLPIPGHFYLGAFANFGSTEDNINQDDIVTYQNLTGKKMAWAYFSNNWFTGISFPRNEVEILSKLDIVPYIRLMPRENFSPDPNQHQYTLERIAVGNYDQEIRQWAIEAKATNVPLIMEFGTEVNGNWFHWNGQWNGGGVTDGYGDPQIADGPEKFIDAYRRIINIFREVEVENITWVYHVNSSSYPDHPWNDLMAYYPGDEYINWIGVSVYGAQSKQYKWLSFTQVFDPAYATITAESEKPILIAEFGVHEKENSNLKAQWLTEAFDALLSNRYPEVYGVSYWHSRWIDENQVEHNINLDSSPAALSAYQAGIAHPAFVSEAKFQSTMND